MNDLMTTEGDSGGYNLPTIGMAPGLALLFDDKLFKRCRAIALDMSNADGFLGKHLVGHPASCFAVLTRAITWKLDPFAVAQCTYETPAGKIGYEGKLIQAILEQSGRLDPSYGGIKFHLFGDWARIRGKFKKAKSEKGKEYFVPDWDPNKDEEGLGLKISCLIKGEAEPRIEEYFLKSFWPRNSTLWALRPEQQIRYAGVRAFANTATPGLLMGVPFDFENPEQDKPPPRPKREDFKEAEDIEEGAVDWTAASKVEATAQDEKAGPENDEQQNQEAASEGAVENNETQEASAGDEETHAPFGHADAYRLGQERASGGYPLSPPRDLEEQFHPSFKEGWEAADAEKRAKNKKK